MGDRFPRPAAETVPGKVYLVGAGPGDPGLITLRGVHCLANADVVLYDSLANPQLLEHAAGAELICVGKHGHSRIWTQTEINAQIVKLAAQGKSVVRLKGGDPAVFARLAEEVDCLRQHALPYEIVPGITAALAVASHAGIPVTDREHASAVALITGQEHPAKETTRLDYQSLARFPGTLVFYMGVTTAGQWTEGLIRGGLSPHTPVALIRRCSWPDQQVIRCQLGQVAARLTPASNLRPPVIAVVGQVADTEHLADWFSRRPLAGQTILVTRPARQTAALRDHLADHGAAVLNQPTIVIEPPEDWAAVDRVLECLGDFDWIVFSSSNGVRCLLDRLWHSGRDSRAFGKAALAAIGPGTAAELERYRLRADLQPPVYRAESLADSLRQRATGQRVLLVRASRGRDILADRLREVTRELQQVVVYQSRDVAEADPEIVQQLREGRIAWTTITSSAIARSAVQLFGDALSQTKLVSISPITSQTLRQLGYPPAVEAEVHTMPGVVAAILAAHKG